MTIQCTRRHLILVAGTGTTTAFLTAGCDNGGGKHPARGTESGDPKVIHVTIHQQAVSPSGSRVDVGTRQPITFQVSSDVAGQLHVHTDPEQVLRYPAGKSTLRLEPIDKPGVVAVEDHALDKVIVQLRVE